MSAFDEGSFMRIGRVSDVGPARASTESAPLQFFIDAMLILVLVMNSAGGIDLFNPGIDMAVAEKAALRIFFYSSFLSSGALIFTCYLFSKIRYVTNWIALAPFIGVAALTMAVSVDLFGTATTLIRAVALFTAINAYIQVRGGSSFIRVSLIFLLITNIESLVVVIVAPSIGIHDSSYPVHVAGAWKGIFSYKNVLAPAALFPCMLLFLFPKLLSIPRFVQIGCAILCLINLWMSGSQTCMMAFVASLIFYFLYMRRRSNIGALMFGFVASVFIGLVLIIAADGILQLLGRDMTLSNRTDIWAYSWGNFIQRPFLGYGFSASSAFLADRLRSQVFHDAVDAHNGYILMALDVGVVGLIAFLFAIFSSVSRALVTWRLESDAIVYGNYAAILCLVASCVVAVAEGTPFYVFGNVGFLTFGSMIAVCRTRRAGRSGPGQILPIR